jgi:hypothetical protein
MHIDMLSDWLVVHFPAVSFMPSTCCGIQCTAFSVHPQEFVSLPMTTIDLLVQADSVRLVNLAAMRNSSLTCH